MFERISRGWALVQQSWQVLRLDKELMLFPIFSTIACVLVMASFALPVILSPTLRESVFAAASPDQAGQQEAVGNADQNPDVGRREGKQPFELTAQQIVPANGPFPHFCGRISSPPR